jgi:uncharacterized protein
MSELASIKAIACQKCGEVFIHSLYHCLSCGSKELEAKYISGRGVIYSHTVIRVPPNEFKARKSYPVIVVQLEQGLLLTGWLTSEDREPAIGLSVELRSLNDNVFNFEIIY